MDYKQFCLDLLLINKKLNERIDIIESYRDDDSELKKLEAMDAALEQLQLTLEGK